MAYLDSLLHPGRAYEEAQKAAEKYYQQAQGFQQPFISHGEEAYGGLSEAMRRLLNPADLYGEWSKGYELSPYAQDEAELVKQQGLDALSASGLLGSSAGARGIQKGTSQILLADRQRYLDDLMNKYLAGAGIANNLYNTGFGASTNASNFASNMGETSSMNAANRYSAPGRMLGNLIGTGVGVAAGLANPGMGLAGLLNKGWSTTGNSSGALKTPGMPKSPFIPNWGGQ
jgi:hypothetical protein